MYGVRHIDVLYVHVLGGNARIYLSVFHAQSWPYVCTRVLGHACGFVPPIPGDDDGAALELLLREGVQYSLDEVVEVAPFAPHRHLAKQSTN